MTIEKEVELKFVGEMPRGAYRPMSDDEKYKGHVSLPAATPIDSRVCAEGTRFGLVVKAIPMTTLPVHVAFWAWSEKDALVLRVLNTNPNAALETCVVKFKLIATEN